MVFGHVGRLGWLICDSDSNYLSGDSRKVLCKVGSRLAPRRIVGQNIVVVRGGSLNNGGGDSDHGIARVGGSCCCNVAARASLRLGVDAIRRGVRGRHRPAGRCRASLQGESLPLTR